MIFVTGLTGHSGQWLARRLVREGYGGPIRYTVRKRSDSEILDRLGLNLTSAIGDISDPTFLHDTLRGVDTVLHIANISYSLEIVRAAISCGVRRVILVHTTGRYSRYKSAANEYIRIEDAVFKLRERIGITVLRPTMIYGSARDKNMYRLIQYLYTHKFFPVFGDGKNLMQPVHARDLGDAYYQVLINPQSTFNRDYNLPGRRAISYLELLRTISAELGSNNVLVPIPMWISILGAKIYNAISDNAKVSVEQVMRMSEDKAFEYDSATNDFGYDPVSFSEGIREEVLEYLGARERSPVA